MAAAALRRGRCISIRRSAMSTAHDGQLSAGTWICDDGGIRMTAEGLPSIFDIIKVLGSQRNPHEVWKRLCVTNPEVLTKCEDLQFPGPGQRETPVAKTKEDAFYILGLLPGAVGRKYREHAAKLFHDFLYDPASVANQVIDKLSEDDKKRLEKRLRSINARNDFTATLKEFGVVKNGFANCTNAVYIGVLGTDARGLKLAISSKTDLPVSKINPRDHMSFQELDDIETAERIAAGQLRRNTVYGNIGVERVVRASAQFTRRLLDGEIDIPVT